VRILYDGLIFSTPQTGGIRRYFANLISRLPVAVEPWLTTTQVPRMHFPQHANLQIRRFPRFRPEKLSSIAERAYFRMVERRTAFELAHPTYYYLLTRRRMADYRCPVVVNVHDMISELFWKGTPAGERETAKKRQAASAADRILCISENSKRDLVELFGVDERKVHVVYLASEVSLALIRDDEPVADRPYFIYVGGREAPYKNFARLLRSFAQVAARHTDVSLCVVGPPLVADELASIERLGLTGRVTCFSGVSDSQLARLYQHSVALVYPSLYEGFGIPPLEAMACQTAVIAANRSSIPEVVGDAGLLVDPESEEELTAAMISVVEDSTLRGELIRRGSQRAKLFNWDKMAQEIYEIYREVVGR
jgi:glycosyltransferase involved in cell wall biosynthesis